MLGLREPQRSFFGAVAQLGREVIMAMGFYGQLAINLVFKDEDFAGAYDSNNGRPSVPPSMLAVARLLQHYDGISDAEVIERTRFDLRYKAALDIEPYSIEAPFAKSTFQAFRARLTLHEKEGLAFERSIQLALENGLLPKTLRLALDSSPVRGKGAVKDTFSLLSDAIASVIRAVARKSKKKAEEVADEAGLGRHVNDTSTSIKGSEIVDWDSQEDVSRFLGGILEDCEQAVKLGENAECASDEIWLLKKIIEQDVEQDEEGTSKLREGVAKDRNPSVTDPDMRHGRKSSGKVFTGHKVHVAVEETSGVILAVEVSSPGEADGEKVSDLIEQSKENTGCEISGAVGDCAYSSATAQEQAESQGIPLNSKMPSPPKGRFGPGAFNVSDNGQTATCPAGHPSKKHYNAKAGTLHIWSPDLCEECPLKPKCTKAEKRQLIVSPDFHSRRQRESWARSEEGRMVLRKRVVVEHAIGRTKNLGAGTARYFGRAKTKVQWQWTAAVANLSLIWSQTQVSPS